MIPATLHANVLGTAVNVSAAVLFIGAVFALFFLHALMKSKGKALAFLISILGSAGGSAFLESFLRANKTTSPDSLHTMLAAGFVAMFVLLYLALGRIMRDDFPSGKIAKGIEAGLIAGVSTGMFFVAAHRFAETSVFSFGLVGPWFTSAQSALWWILAALVVLLFVTR